MIKNLLILLTLILTGMVPASALPLDAYAPQSRLASGRWIRISVPESGLYAITPAMLRSWGFSDATKVRVYGYGGTRISDILDAASYTDDLPAAPQQQEADGTIVFYGRGPESWEPSASTGRYINNTNIYTDRGYYFVSDTGEEIPAMTVTGTPDSDASRTPGQFNERVQHELEAVSPGEAGAHLVGEDFRLTPNRTFTFDMPGRVEGTDVWFECSFVARTLAGDSKLTFFANGNAIDSNSSDVIAKCTSDGHYHGVEGISRHTLTNLTGTSLKLGVSHSSSVTVYGAWLNYLTVNYTRTLSLASDGHLCFTTSTRPMALGGTGADTRIWDVTDVHRPLRVDFARSDDGTARWTSAYGTTRTYAAYTPGKTLPAPQSEGIVANQNLHALESPDMVIVTPAAFRAGAERVAALHRNEGLDVLVVSEREIYNEFASGSADVSALRRFFKMLFDRGTEAGRPLRFALLMGRATYDNRHLTAYMADAAPTLPSWYGGTMKTSLSDTDGYGTDDFTAMLLDGTGANKGLDELSIAIGRIPVTSTRQCNEYIDKLEQYIRRPRMTAWKNNIMMLADDEDSGVHMRQSETMSANILNTPGQQYMLNKVYIDAYTKTGGNYPLAREAMFRNLDEGTAWWTFIGHANNHSMTHDGQLTYNDINNMFLKHVPILYAATCDFLRWDSNTLSGGEILMHTRHGGTIATISATRPVYIYENELFSNAMGRWIAARGDDGRYFTLGEIYRRAKNDIRNVKGDRVSSTNRLRYVLMGDPAMRLPSPDNLVTLDAIDGKPLDGGADAMPPQIKALQTVTLSGTVTDPDGRVLDNFDGHVTVTIYDAEESVTSNGNGDGQKITFEQQGGRLFAGSAPVEKGHWELRVSMPAEIADNYRPAAANMYAVADGDGAAEAIGVERRFYVSGFDDSAAPDVTAPVIDEFYLNHSPFAEGEIVNPSPMAIARVSDDVAINLSTAGIGHNITLILDGSKRYTDVSQFYTPATDGSASGAINYPLHDLQTGPHELMLRVWDTAGNATTRTIAFNVGAGVSPKIFDIYSDANPASVQANFYLTHNRPDQQATVTVTVYNLLGRPLWSNTVTGVSDMILSTPVSWDLTDASGRRVPRGIYLYRATIKCDGESFDTGSRRIAVTD